MKNSNKNWVKRIILCADDYGQVMSVSDAIIELVQKERISATTCLVNFKDWYFSALRLQSYRDQIDVGLHLNFTEGSPISADFKRMYGDLFPSLPKLILQACTRQLKLDVFAAECQAQLDRFIEGMEGYPDFIDGHQHVIQLPGVRQMLMQVYAERLGAKNIYLRLVNPKEFIKTFSMKSWVIQLLGSNAMARLLKKNQIPHNQSFSGIYAFNQAKNFRLLFPRFLSEISDQGIIMCHPGHAPTWRAFEFDYLKSDQFLKDLDQHHVTIQRFETLTTSH